MRTSYFVLLSNRTGESVQGLIGIKEGVNRIGACQRLSSCPGACTERTIEIPPRIDFSGPGQDGAAWNCTS